jgi:hypothetical protein
MLILPGQANVTCTQSKVPNPSILLELKIYDNVLFQSKGILSPKKLLFKKQNRYKEETLNYLERWC